MAEVKWELETHLPRAWVQAYPDGLPSELNGATKGDQALVRPEELVRWAQSRPWNRVQPWVYGFRSDAELAAHVEHGDTRLNGEWMITVDDRVFSRPWPD